VDGLPKEAPLRLCLSLHAFAAVPRQGAQWKKMIELSISSPKESFTLDAVVNAMLDLGICACVTPTLSTCTVDGASPSEPRKLQIERGVCVKLVDCDQQRFADVVWPALKERFELQCGWVDATVRGFRGCTENFCRASSCPQCVTEPGKAAPGA